MSKQFINLNGKFYPEHEPVLSVLNRGFKYGDGLFESMRWMKGAVQFIDLHIDRLKKGMDLLQYQNAALCNPDFLSETVRRLAEKNQAGFNARARLTIFRQGAGLYVPETNEAGYVLELSPLPDARYVLNASGLSLGLFDQWPKPLHPLSELKSCNASLFVMAGLFKRRAGLDEVLLLNQNGFLCEALYSNVFVVHHQVIYTPALSEGCVAGVMRKVVIQLAHDHRVPLVQAPLHPDLLSEADEVFLTNAIRGIQWVGQLHGKQYLNDMARFLAHQLNQSV